MCFRDVRPIPRASRTASRDPDTRHSMLMKFNGSFYRKHENYFRENEPQLYIFRRDFFIEENRFLLKKIDYRNTCSNKNSFSHN